MLNSEFLGKENVHKLIIRLGSFAVIAMLATGAQIVLTTWIVSRGIDIYAVSAIGVLSPLIAVYFGCSQLVAIGAASYISRKLGEEKKDEVLTATISAYLMTLVISIGLMVLTWIFKGNILSLLGADGEVAEFARKFLSVFVYSIPFTAMMLLSSAIFRAYGKLSLSMLVVLVEAGLIIGLDYLFVFILSNGIRSVAASHIIAGIISSLLGIALLFKLNAKSKVTIKLFKLNMDAAKGIISIGVSALARALAGAALGLILNLMIRSLGEDDALAALGAVNRITIFFAFAIMGMSQAMQPIVSYNFTAKQNDRVKKAVRYALIYALIIGIIGSALGLLLPHQVVRVFTNDTDVLDDAAVIFRMQLLLFFTTGVQILSATYFQAIGKARMSFFLSVFKQLFIFIPLAYFLPRLLGGGVANIWWAFPISDLIAFIICMVLLKRGMRELKVTD